MSTKDTKDTPGRPGGWTDGEKFSFLLQIIAQLNSKSTISIKWDEINLPGRTPKSLQNMWAKIKSEASGFGEIVGDGTNSGANTPKATPKPRARKAKPEADGDGSPTKKKRASPKKKAVKVEEETKAICDANLDEDDFTNVKSGDCDAQDDELADDGGDEA